MNSETMGRYRSQRRNFNSPAGLGVGGGLARVTGGGDMEANG